MSTTKELPEDEECPIESDTCAMTTQELSKEKNEELLKHSLNNLDDLL